MKIGDRVFVHGYVDEIRKDTVIIRNNGGYFGTIPSEIIKGDLVRCKGCIWYLKDGSCARHFKQFEPYDFCSYGDRGEEDDETGSN